MPSSATITSFYSFAANTRARASEVENNFGVMRGHFIPIDPNTQTSIDATYDIGSTEYRWRTGYFDKIDIDSNTSTGQALQIAGDTASGAGAFLMKVNGTVRARFGGGNNYISLDTTTSKMDWLFGGSTVASLNPTYFVLPRKTLNSSSMSGTYTEFTNTSFTLCGTLSVTSYGMNMLIGINICHGITNRYVQCFSATTPAGNIPGYTFKIFRDSFTSTSVVAWEQFRFGGKQTTTDSTVYSERTGIGPFLDDSITAGGHTYYVYASIEVSSAVSALNLQNCALQAIETV